MMGTKLIAQLRQLVAPVPRAEIADFEAYAKLWASGLVGCEAGYCFLTSRGVAWCARLGILDTAPTGGAFVAEDLKPEFAAFELVNLSVGVTAGIVSPGLNVGTVE